MKNKQSVSLDAEVHRNKKSQGALKGSRVSVRFDYAEERFLADLANSTGLKKAEIIRRAGRYAFPRFLSREINILDGGKFR